MTGWGANWGDDWGHGVSVAIHVHATVLLNTLRRAAHPKQPKVVARERRR